MNHKIKAYRPEENNIYTANWDTVSITSLRMRDWDDSERYAVHISGWGMGGAGLMRMRAIDWDEYTQLNDELKEVALADTDTVVKPPASSRMAQKAGLAAFLWPDRAGALYHHFDEHLGIPDEYSKFEEDARYPKDIDDILFNELENKAKFEEIEPGMVYLKNGEYTVYTDTSIGPEQSSTEYRISGLKTSIVDLSEIAIVPFQTGLNLPDNVCHKLEDREGVWLQSAKDNDETRRRLKSIFFTITHPKSLTTRFASEREWAEFHRGFNRTTSLDDISDSDDLKEFVKDRGPDIRYYIFDKLTSIAESNNL